MSFGHKRLGAYLAAVREQESIPMPIPIPTPKGEAAPWTCRRVRRMFAVPLPGHRYET